MWGISVTTPSPSGFHGSIDSDKTGYFALGMTGWNFKKEEPFQESEHEKP